jgi:sec-independent protein translocase protein TatA
MLAKIGTGEIIIILIVALVVFGPDKLPQIGRSVGKAVSSFKKHMDDATKELREAVEDVGDLGSEIREVSKDVADAVRADVKPEQDQKTETAARETKDSEDTGTTATAEKNADDTGIAEEIIPEDGDVLAGQAR